MTTAITAIAHAIGPVKANETYWQEDVRFWFDPYEDIQDRAELKMLRKEFEPRRMRIWD